MMLVSLPLLARAVSQYLSPCQELSITRRCGWYKSGLCFGEIQFIYKKEICFPETAGSLLSQKSKSASPVSNVIIRSSISWFHPRVTVLLAAGYCLLSASHTQSCNQSIPQPLRFTISTKETPLSTQRSFWPVLPCRPWPWALASYCFQLSQLKGTFLIAPSL